MFGVSYFFFSKNKGKQHIRVHKDAILEVQKKENFFTLNQDIVFLSVSVRMKKEKNI